MKVKCLYFNTDDYSINNCEVKESEIDGFLLVKEETGTERLINKENIDTMYLEFSKNV